MSESLPSEAIEIRDMVSIRGRLFEVLDRAVSDHWEDGLLADKNGVSAIATIVGVFFVVPPDSPWQ